MSTNQNWIINDSAAEDDYMLKFYLNQNETAKFQLFISNSNKQNPDEIKMDVEESYDGWKCEICTLINEPLKEYCDACSSKKTTNNNEVNKLKIQKLNDYLAYDLCDLNENTELFKCEICLEEEVGPREGGVLKECLHVFCK